MRHQGGNLGPVEREQRQRGGGCQGAAHGARLGRGGRLHQRREPRARRMALTAQTPGRWSTLGSRSGTRARQPKLGPVEHTGARWSASSGTRARQPSLGRGSGHGANLGPAPAARWMASRAQTSGAVEPPAQRQQPNLGAGGAPAARQRHQGGGNYGASLGPVERTMGAAGAAAEARAGGRHQGAAVHQGAARTSGAVDATARQRRHGVAAEAWAQRGRQRRKSRARWSASSAAAEPRAGERGSGAAADEARREARARRRAPATRRGHRGRRRAPATRRGHRGRREARARQPTRREPRARWSPPGGSRSSGRWRAPAHRGATARRTSGAVLATRARQRHRGQGAAAAPGRGEPRAGGVHRGAARSSGAVEGASATAAEPRALWRLPGRGSGTEARQPKLGRGGGR